MLVRAVSNAVPEDPVVDPKTGYVYERSLIEKYLHDQGKCPMTGGQLSKEDLLPLKAGRPVKPRHTPSMSVPGVLGTLHQVRSCCQDCVQAKFNSNQLLPLLTFRAGHPLAAAPCSVSQARDVLQHML